MNLDCSGKQVQVKDSFDHLVGGIPVTLSAKTLDVNQETSDLESKKSVTRSSDGVASFVVNLPSEVTVLEFNVSWSLLLNFLGQCVLLTVGFGQCAEKNVVDFRHESSEQFHNFATKGKKKAPEAICKLIEKSFRKINVSVFYLGWIIFSCISKTVLKSRHMK